MPILLRRDDGGQILIIHATGKVEEADYRDQEPQFEALAPHTGKLRVLFEMNGLHCWVAAAAGQDIKFDIRHFADIHRLAIIGENPWQHWLAPQLKPLKRGPNQKIEHKERGGGE